MSMHRVGFLTERGVFTDSDGLYLVPDGRPVIAPPSVKTNFVEVPGSSGTLDLSQSLTGYPLYGNREGDLKFHVLNDKPISWAELYQQLMSAFHGQRSQVVLEDDPDYRYEGTLAIGEWVSNNDGTWSDVTIHYTLDPYKYYQYDTDVTRTLSNGSWQFDFQDGSIGAMPMVPEITVSNIVVTTTTTTVNIGGSGSGSSGSGSSGSSGSNSGDDGIIVLDGNGDDSGSGSSGSGSSGSSGTTQTITEVTGGIYLTASNTELGINNLTKHITANGTYKFYDMIFSKLSNNNINSLTISGSGRVQVHYRRGEL